MARFPIICPVDQRLITRAPAERTLEGGSHSGYGTDALVMPLRSADLSGRFRGGLVNHCRDIDFSGRGLGTRTSPAHRQLQQPVYFHMNSSLFRLFRKDERKLEYAAQRKKPANPGTRYSGFATGASSG